MSNHSNHNGNGNGRKDLNLTEIKRRADIRDVWAALGGGPLRGNRGRAFWREGDGYSVSLDANRGLWHDFVSGAGGDVITLVRAVQQCGFLEAAEWLANHTGVSDLSANLPENLKPADWRTDLMAATWWSMAAVILAEDTLASLSCYDPDRRNLTDLLARIRLGNAALVEEYRAWRKWHPQLTTAMIRAGRRSDARIQNRVALWLRRYLDEAA